MSAAALEQLGVAMLAARDAATLVPLPSAEPALTGFDLDQAYRVADQTRRLRMARGEQPRGYKIGFTNRSIWPKYGVHAPIWGPVWAGGLQILEGAQARISLAGLVQPRLEPEIVFGFARAPEPGMDDAALLACIDWVAHGVELVHTHYADWRFTAPDTVADFALHGSLVVGPRCAVARFGELAEELAALQIDLFCDAERVDQGQGRAVLDSPWHALRHWLQAMARQTPAWPVAAGDVVTTGTLTDAWPVLPGQRWTTVLSDKRLSGLQIEFVD